MAFGGGVNSTAMLLLVVFVKGGAVMKVRAWGRCIDFSTSSPNGGSFFRFRTGGRKTKWPWFYLAFPKFCITVSRVKPLEKPFEGSEA